MGSDDGGGGWQPLIGATRDDEALETLREAIVRVRFAPHSQELRRRLRGIAALPNVRDRSISILASEVQSALCEEPAVAAILLEVLVRAYETSDRPIEAVAATEQLVALEPDNVEHLLSLASQCVNLGAWPKAAEAFERAATLGTQQQACAALRAAIKLYRENARPDRAVNACRAIIARRPADKEAWHDLEELLEQLCSWRELAEIRGELAKRAASPVDKARLLRGQAHALAQADDVAAAAEVMATAARYVPDDISGILEHADMLARTGKGREAADLLAKRIGEAITRRASMDEIAGLRARHAELLDGCGDREAAALVVEQLLADYPSYAPALERLVEHASDHPDPRVHAEALERYAAVLDDFAGKATLYVEAARRYRDSHEFGRSLRAFERAIDLSPDTPGLHEELEEVRARIGLGYAATDLSSGDVDAARERICRILAARPYDPHANLALADLLVATNNARAARDLLQHVLATAPDHIPRQRLATLAHKYALVVEADGDADEAYRLLHEAHLLDRHALLISLDIGQRCFARKLWRQVIIHLAPLAEHPDAPRHAARVAEGLVQAGQAEVRALRPANALKHYQAAVRLDPKCPSAWHALGADAMEHGDLERAVKCFECEAKATTTPSEKRRLLDALGDLAQNVLGDPARAEAYWSKAADGDVAILRKLLAAQRARNADIDRAETCIQLAALDPAQHKQLTQEAADLFAAAGDFVRARAAAERLMAAHPLDVDAVSCASAVVLGACDADTAAAWLQRALDAWQSRRAHEPRQAELWRRLGDAERSRQRPVQARTAYERAIATATAPDSAEALAARRGMMALTPKSARTLESLEALVEAEQAPDEVLALARAFIAADRIDDARAIFDLAHALRHELATEDEQFLARTTPRQMAYDEAYGGILDEKTRHEVIDDANDGPLANVFDVLAAQLRLLVPDPATALQRAGLAGASRLSATSRAAVAVLYPQVSKALAGPATLVYASDDAHDEVHVLLASPPVVVIGSRLASIRENEAAPATDAMLRFKLGRAVELARPRRILAAGTDTDAFVLLVAGLQCAFGPRRDGSLDTAIAAEAKRLHDLLSIPLRRRIGELLANVPQQQIDAHAFLAACKRAADRSGLIACGNAACAIAATAEPNIHLVRCAASRRYRVARRELRKRGR